MHSGYSPLLHAGVSIVGWLAAAAVLAAYAMLMSGRLSATSGRYLAINAVGSAGLAMSTVTAHAWQAFAVNALWLAFGIAPLARALRARQRRRARQQRLRAHRPRMRRRPLSPRAIGCTTRVVTDAAGSTDGPDGSIAEVPVEIGTAAA